MATSWMRILDMKYLRVFVMRSGRMRVYVMHAFCMRNIEGQIMVNDSTGNLIDPY